MLCVGAGPGKMCETPQHGLQRAELIAAEWLNSHRNVTIWFISWPLLVTYTGNLNTDGFSGPVEMETQLKLKCRKLPETAFTFLKACCVSLCSAILEPLHNQALPLLLA